MFCWYDPGELPTSMCKSWACYPSPILMYPISSTETRCLVDIPGQKVPSISSGEMAKYLKTLVAPQVCCNLQRIFSSLFGLYSSLFMFNDVFS
jgi:hypothetical protein